MTDPGWISAHLVHGGDLDALLLSVVGRVNGSGLAGELFFLRYWEGGDHLRLRIRPARQGGDGELRALLTEHCRGYFAAHPSQQADPERYAEQARALAALERLPAWDEVQLPNDSVVFRTYRPEYDRYGGEDAMPAVERHFVESSRIALAVLSARPSPDRRQTAALSLLMLAAAIGGSTTDETGPPRERVIRDLAEQAGFARRFDEHREKLVELDRRMTAFRAGRPRDAGVLAAWCGSLTALREALLARGSIGGDHVRAILDTCGHLLCNRLGLSLPEEAYVRYLIGRLAQAREPEAVRR